MRRRWVRVIRSAQRVCATPLAVSIGALALCACELVVGGDYSVSPPDDGGLAGDDASGGSSGISGSSGSESSGGNGSSGGTAGSSSSGAGSSGGSVSGGSSGNGGGSSGGASTNCTLAPNSCTGGDTCLASIDSDNTVSAACASPGSAAVGSTCTADSDCVAGAGCFGGSGTFLCSPWCQLSPSTTACGSRTPCTALSPGEVVGAVTYGGCLYDGPAAFVGYWTGTLNQTFSNCGYADDDGSYSAESSDTFALSGAGIADTTASDCTFNLTVSGNIATIAPGSTCTSTEESGAINEFTITSGSFTISVDGTTLMGSATGTEEVIIDGEDSDTCEETVSGTETYQGP